MIRTGFPLILILLLLAGLPPAARGDVLSMVPKDYEFVAGANARQIADSELFKKFLKMRPGMRNQMQRLERSMGVDLTRDVDRIYVYGKSDNQDSIGIILKGRIDPQHVLQTVAGVSGVTTRTVYGLPVHDFRDRNDGRSKCCAFLPDGTAIFWNSQAAMENSLKAVSDASQSFLGTPEADLIPDEANASALWAVSVDRHSSETLSGQVAPTPTPTPTPTPEVTTPVRGRKGPRRNGMRRRGPRAFNYDHMTFCVTMNAKAVQLRMTLNMPSAADGQRWAQTMRGAIGLGQVQTNNTLFHDLAAQAKVEMQDGDKTGILTTGLDVNNTLDLITGRKNLDDNSN